MRRAFLLLTLVAATVFACAGVVLAQQAEDRTTSGAEEKESAASDENAPPKTPKKPIPDNYIVVLNEDADPDRVANEHARQHGAQLKFVYRNAIQGYAAVIPEGRLRAIERDSRVDYVEQDQEVSITAQKDNTKKKQAERSDGEDTAGGKSGGEDSAATQGEDQQRKAGKPSKGEDVSAAGQTLPWGIGKIEANNSSTLAGNGSGAISNVNAYIIDSGIAKHRDLNKVGHVNFAGGKNDDCNGHGTHVAGTVAAKDDGNDVVGAAPGAPLTGVKVLGCSGSGTWSGVIKGIDWVTANAKKPAVANMSLGGGKSQAVNDAVTKSADSGIFYALAAGNDGDDACNKSPASAGTHAGVMTVAATDKSDAETSWSNYGNCVDIWAPGASILSTKMGGGTTTMSGTSMASPHGAGGGALYLSKNTTKNTSEVESALKSAVTTTSSTSKDGKTTIVRENVGGF